MCSYPRAHLNDFTPVLSDMLQYVLRDIYIMRNLARVFQKLKGLVTKQRAFDVALLDTFASASLQELDYLNEAANQVCD
jgi:predicted unusual protein kinase regulating ubiquinone biosynthesis (AarF/ABC1/UbiB family)